MRIQTEVLVVLLLLCLITRSAKPKLKGLVPGTAAAFRQSGSEEILAYYDLDRDGKYTLVWFRIDILTKSVNTTAQFLNAYIWNSKLKEYLLSG